MYRRFSALTATVVVAATGIAGGAAARALVPPQTASPPTIEGAFREGELLRGTTGVWRNNPTTFTYTWQRCDANGQSCATIAGGPTYRLTSRDVGRTVRLLVTASNRDGSATANSKPSPVIVANVAPANTTPPSISGTPRVGEKLTANAGVWVGADVLAYQWQRCTGAVCADVAGATSQAYGVLAADQGRTLRVLVTATNPRGAVTAASPPTAVVRGPLTGGVVTRPTAVSVASISLPNRLVIARVEFVPRVIRSRSRPIAVRVLVTDLRDRPVSGALVLARGVPSNRVSTARERATRANGWATLRFRPLRALPLRRGATLVFFVRARKAGEPLLAGVSTRRLVQVRVAPR